jgi:hypothetical protein
VKAAAARGDVLMRSATQFAWRSGLALKVGAISPCEGLFRQRIQQVGRNADGSQRSGFAKGRPLLLRALAVRFGQRKKVRLQASVNGGLCITGQCCGLPSAAANLQR